MLSLFGIGMFALIYGGMLWRTSWRWRQIAENYAGETPRFFRKKQAMQSAVLVSSSGYNSLKGILTIGAHEDGISLSVMKLFSLFHEPLFIPYSDIECGNAKWYLDARSVELTLRKAPDIKLIMSAEQFDWITTASARKISAQNSSVQRESPTGRWHAFATIHAGVSLIMVGWIGWLVISGQIPIQ